MQKVRGQVALIWCEASVIPPSSLPSYKVCRCTSDGDLVYSRSIFYGVEVVSFAGIMFTWTNIKNSSKYGKLPSREVKIGFRTILRPLVGRGGPKKGAERSRTLPKAFQTSWDPDSLDSLAQSPILTFSSTSTKFDYK